MKNKILSLNLYFLLVILTIVFSDNTNAIVGSYLDWRDVPDQACVINGLMKSTHALALPDVTTCSATIVSYNQALTAAHCFQNIQQLVTEPYIRCNGEPKSYKINLKQVSFHKDYGINLDHDIAVVEIEGFFETPPMELALTKEKMMEYFSCPNFCALVGAGKDNDNKVGIIRGTQVLQYQTSVKDTKGKPIDFFTDVGSENSIRPGDSGGALACRMMNNKWILIGINVFIFSKDGKQIVTKEDKKSASGAIEYLFHNGDWVKSQLYIQ